MHNYRLKKYIRICEQVPLNYGTQVCKSHHIIKLLKVHGDKIIRGVVSLDKKKGIRGVTNLKEPQIVDTSIGQDK